MLAIKAIETIYKGYRFRSRLEARWAVFFDALGIEWEYEFEGYDLGNGLYYLPDFWLPKLNLYVEIKGKRPTIGEYKKAHYLNMLSEKTVAILGKIPDPENWICDGDYLGDVWYLGNSEYIEDVVLGAEDEQENAFSFYPHDQFYYFAKCEQCKEIGFHFEGRTRQCDCVNKYNDADQTCDYEALTVAYAKARQARFEHGAKHYD